MLDKFCNSLTDEAQLRIALKLGKLTLPVWEDYFIKNPTAIDQINALMSDSDSMYGSLKKIDIEFPKRALEKIERSFAVAKEQSIDKPIPIMKSDATLSPLLATCMQPLSNPQWDNTLNQSTRLVFTIVFNILVWILYRRNTDHHETHIYVAINQGADVLLREKIHSEKEINAILHEFEQLKRREAEDTNWENARPVGNSEQPDQEDIYRKIIGEKIVKGQGSQTLAIEVLRQMREERKSYWNMMDEYATGTSTTYSYDQEKQSYSRHEMDVIVASFSNHILMTESEMLSFISQQNIIDLRESGFEV
ncbi:MAG: hypothetical protein JNM78_03270 [Cyclobacteriaceae bacterium]|nr:hypothetical protein [Cyclobacteriaceae bacterium]